MEMKDKINKMVGRTYMVNANYHKVLSAKITENLITIVTDQKWFEFTLDKADQIEEKFLEVEGDETNNGTLVMFGTSLQPVQNLKDTILENIKKVQEDKNYIPQASAVNDGINSMINIFKLELEFAKALRK